MCTCITELTNNIRRDLKNKTENVVQWDDPGEFENIVTVHGKRRITMPFRYAYTRRKNSGEPEKKITNGEVKISPKFCPFCGTKLAE